MKCCEVEFNFQKLLENELISLNIVKFARKFKMCIRCVGTAEDRYKLLKEDFVRFYPYLNFAKEWKKVVDE